MSSWVLPGILKVSEVGQLPHEFLVGLSTISTGIIMNYVNKFIADNEGSSDPTVQAAASALKSAYEEVNRISDYLNSEEAKTLSDTLCSLQYSDVSAEIPIEKLIVYRSTILDLLSEDEDFVAAYNKDIVESETRGYKTAYTPKLDEDNYISGIRMMNAAAKESNYRGLCETVMARIFSNDNLFKNSRAKLNSPTVLRKAIYKKDRLKSLLRGIDYLIEKKRSGAAPRSWRRV